MEGMGKKPRRRRWFSRRGRKPGFCIVWASAGLWLGTRHELPIAISGLLSSRRIRFRPVVEVADPELLRHLVTHGPEDRGERHLVADAVPRQQHRRLP